MSAYDDPELRELFFAETPIIDVRSPVEFSEGSLPYSINLPIMYDEERALVGTCYKEQGQEAAITLGHSLVSGEIKLARINAWKNAIAENPKAQVFCFRGGLRSQISCQWLRENGVERYPITGGYKRMRRFFLSQIEEAPLPKLIRLGGLTGSGKTITLNKDPHAIDLEGLASHRGSAFGENGIQPSQVRFENELALKLMQTRDFCLVEDESSMIGRIRIPRRFFLHMRSAPVVILKTTLDQRIQNIHSDYVLKGDREKLLQSLSKIAKGLGGVGHKSVEADLLGAFEKGSSIDDHASWISTLLKDYYDPSYARDIARQGDLILFEGNEAEVLSFLAEYK